jgi:ubiquinone/menaquinone biosynthesis C-methylase UbiE
MDTMLIRRAINRRKFFQIIAPVYDISARFVLLGQYDHLRNQLKGKIDLREGMRILDIATGTGYVAEILNPGIVVCTDITIQMLKKAKAKTRGDFLLSDAHHLPFRDEVFDVAISSFALHEMAMPRVVLTEMFRTLKAGGKIVVMDVVQQEQLLKRIEFQIFHTLVDMRAANYMKLEELEDVFQQANEFNMQWEMYGLVTLVWGKKKFE